MKPDGRRGKNKRPLLVLILITLLWTLLIGGGIALLDPDFFG